MPSLLDTLKMIPGQLGAAIPKVIAGTGLAAGRLGVGAAQDLSGLVDLVSPGTGTSRVTQGLSHAAQGIDRTAQNANNVNSAYHIMQAALTPASFYAPGAAVSRGVKGAGMLGQAIPAVTNAATKLADGNGMSRIAGQALQGARPINAINAAIGTAGTLGHMSSQGQDINPVNGSLAAALNLAAPFALPAAGQGAMEVPGAIQGLYGKAAMAQTSRNSLRGNIGQLDQEIAGWERQMQGLPAGDARSWDLLQRKIDRNQAIKQSLKNH